jgi:hypothetical protein
MNTTACGITKPHLLVKLESSDEELTARVVEVYIAMATESWPKEDVEGEGVRRWAV